MNYYTTCELADKEGKPSGLHHYTVTNDNRTRPAGYCADGCPGHPTPEEAREHYKQYLLDHRLRLDGKNGDTQHKCKVCGEWTQGVAFLDETPFALCDEHRTREKVSELYGDVGDVASSW